MVEVPGRVVCTLHILHVYLEMYVYMSMYVYVSLCLCICMIMYVYSCMHAA